MYLAFTFAQFTPTLKESYQQVLHQIPALPHTTILKQFLFQLKLLYQCFPSVSFISKMCFNGFPFHLSTAHVSSTFHFAIYVILMFCLAFMQSVTKPLHSPPYLIPKRWTFCHVDIRLFCTRLPFIDTIHNINGKGLLIFFI